MQEGQGEVQVRKALLDTHGYCVFQCGKHAGYTRILCLSRWETCWIHMDTVSYMDTMSFKVGNMRASPKK